MTNIEDAGLYIITGLQGSGKSRLIKSILYNKRKKFYCGLVFCQTDFSDMDNGYDYIPQGFVHPNYNEKVLKKFMNIQKKLVKDGTPKYSFIVLDDCCTKNIWTSALFKSISVQLRHYKVLMILSVQFPNMIPPTWRSNAFGSFMFQTNQSNALKSLYESYGGAYGTYNEFKDFLMKSTGDHRFVHFDSRSKASNPRDRYKVLKCPEIPDFTMEYSYSKNNVFV